MPQYRRKNHTIEAVQWDPPNSSFAGIHEDTGGHFVITKTNEKKVYISPGDYLLPEGEGYWFPVPASVFEHTYEEAPVLEYVSQAMAYLIENAVQAAVIEERKACANVAGDAAFTHEESPEARWGKACKAAILRRGEV